MALCRRQITTGVAAVVKVAAVAKDAAVARVEVAVARVEVDAAVVEDVVVEGKRVEEEERDVDGDQGIRA